jgi:hypothetical protein
MAYHFTTLTETTALAIVPSIKLATDGFKSKSRSDHEIDRDGYLTRFSTEKWSDLTNTEKQRHTLGNCTGCSERYQTSTVLSVEACLPAYTGNKHQSKGTSTRRNEEKLCLSSTQFMKMK